MTGVVLSSKRPWQRALYLQVRDALAERIATGVWKPGTAVANEGDLAREIGVSPGTVRKALELMEAQRLISRRQGRGTFVSDQTSEELAARLCNLRGPNGERLHIRPATVAVREGEASEQEGRRLRIAAGAPVYRIRRVRRREQDNFVVKDAVVPAALFPGLVDKQEVAGSISAIAQAFGILVGTAEERISLRIPPLEIAGALGVVQGVAVMHLERLVFRLDGPPVEWSTAYCHLPGGYYLASCG